eukprot:m.307836 g.307836  ORF g.307836 m.307836 type:complete len:85 (+) comp42902_c0_seq1:25-279(+)
MLRTWLFCTAGGLFTACWSNLLRQYPMWRKPQLHATCTAVGAFVGYYFHKYEQGAESRYRRIAKGNERVPKWLVETYIPKQEGD